MEKKNNYIQEVEKYIKYLVDNDETPELIDFARHINTLNSEPIDLSFMEKFIKYTKKRDICIRHTHLLKLGVFSDVNSNGFYCVKRSIVDSTILSNDGKSKVPMYKENIDWKYVDPLNPKRKQDIMMTTRTFKDILLKNQLTVKYRNYYLFLEEAFGFYRDFQSLAKEKKLEICTNIISKKDIIISEKEDKIDELKNIILKQGIDVKESFNNLNEKINEVKEQKNDELLEEIYEVNDQNVELINKVAIISNDVPIPPNNAQKYRLYIVKKKDGTNKIRTLTCYVGELLKNLGRSTFKDFDITNPVYDDYTPSRNDWDNMYIIDKNLKKMLTKNGRLKEYKLNDNYTLKDVADTIRSIYIEKNNDIINSTSG